RRQPGWGYKVVLVLALLTTVVVGAIEGPGFLNEGMRSKWIYDWIYSPMSSTMFALLAFFIASAAFRAFRIRTVEAGLLAAAALIVMLGRVPLGDAITRAIVDHPGLPHWLRDVRIGDLQQWVMD